jgi:AcrR family transcriptional regulator
VPKIVDHDQYRDQLLRGCYTVFARHGYSLSMREAAKALSVSTGTLYHYFPTKHVLFEQLVLAASAWDEANALKDVTEAQEPKARLRAFLKFIEKNEEHFTSQQLLIGDYIRGITNEGGELSPFIKMAASHYVDVIAETLSLSHDRASMVLTFVSGVVTRRFFDQKTTSYEKQAKTLIALLYP